MDYSEYFMLKYSREISLLLPFGKMCFFATSVLSVQRHAHSKSYCITNVVICSREMRRLQLVPTLLHIKAVVCNQGNLVGTVFRSLFYRLDSGVKIVLSNLVMYMLKEGRCCYL